MQDHSSFFTNDIYLEYLTTFNGINFTRREIDIIACLLNARRTNKIAALLSIAPRTVVTHTRNIMLKLNCNSQDGIIDFIERSEKLPLIRKYYFNLLIHASFEKTLREISKLNRGIGPSCLIVSWRGDKHQNSLLSSLVIYLNLAGIHVSKEIREDSHILTSLQEPSGNAYVIYVASQILFNESTRKESEKPSTPTSLLAPPGSENIFFLLLDGEQREEIPQELPVEKIFYFSTKENGYFLIFEILKHLLPTLKVEEIFLEFKKRYESPYDPSIDNSSPSSSSPKAHDTSSQLLLNRICSLLKKKKWHYASGFFAIGIIGIGLLGFQGNKTEKEIKAQYSNQTFSKSQENTPTSSLRSDLIIPTTSFLLDRSELLSEIGKKFLGNQPIKVVALIGIGGAGKTTIARCYGDAQQAPVVWEINAESHESLLTSFESLAYALATREEERKELQSLQDIKNIKEKKSRLLFFVKKRLKELQSWFLIYDNVVKFTEIKDYFPQDSKTWGKGDVLLTTRDSSLQNNSHLTNSLYVGELSPQEKLTLFSKIMNHGMKKSLTLTQRKEMEKFLTHIPPFPLDVSTAAYYLTETNTPYEHYVEHLKQGDKTFEDSQGDVLKQVTDYPKTRQQIIALCLQKVLGIQSEFKDLLLFVCLLDSQNIPRELLEAYKDDITVDNFIHHLKKYSLITVHSLDLNKALPTVAIHRSTQEISLGHLTKALSPKEKQKILQSITYIIEEYTSNIINNQDYSKMQLLVNHCESFLAHTCCLINASRGSISGKLGSLYYELENYGKAKKLLEESLIHLNKNSSQNREKIAWSLNYLGNVYRVLCEYEKSIDFLEKSLLLYRKFLPEDSLDIARNIRYLGMAYRNLGNFKKAEKLFQQSLAIYKNHLPKTSINFARTLRYLGMAHRSLGNYKKAKGFFEESLALYKKHLSENHKAYAIGVAYVGNIERNLGNYKKATKCLEESLAIFQEFFPNEGIDIAWTSVYLGILYRNLGEHEKSKKLHEVGYDIYKKLFPENHIKVAWAAGHLGNIYTELGYYAKARDLLEKSLAVYKRLNPDNHYEIARTQLYLANAYKGLKNFKKAEKLLQESLITYEKTYGKNHVETGRVLGSLGQVYLGVNRLDSAEKFLNKSLRNFQDSKHPKAYISLEDLAILYLKRSEKAAHKGDKQKYRVFKQRATDSLKQVLEIVKSTFPENSPHILRVQEKIKELEQKEKRDILIKMPKVLENNIMP